VQGPARSPFAPKNEIDGCDTPKFAPVIIIFVPAVSIMFGNTFATDGGR
jgi:hypothetical protein